MGVNLQKEVVGNVPVWVKNHGVPMTAFSEDDLSIIATKLCTPLMLNSYTSDMCMQSWGWTSYARAMIELRADEELKDTIMVAMPKLVGEGFNICTIRVEYEWKSPRCSSCKVFGLVLNECPKKIVSDVTKKLSNPRQATRGLPVGTKQKGLINLKDLIEGKLLLVDDNGKPLLKVVSTVNADSDSEVDDMKRNEIMTATDDLYDSHDMSDNLQALCDEFDITVCGRKKK
ncbi:RNA-directed DNA polymerase, eukaryota, reverse transcriptase zinc-binding domain protein [Tanacetum coccineum]